MFFLLTLMPYDFRFILSWGFIITLFYIAVNIVRVAEY